MGKYSELRTDDSFEKILKKCDDKIKSNNARLDKRVADYQLSMAAFMGLDKMLFEKNKAVAQQVGVMASSALCFIPVFGPMAYAVVSSMIKSNSRTLTGVLIDAGMAAIQYNAATMISKGATNNYNVGVYLATGSGLQGPTPKPTDNVGMSFSNLSGTGNMIASALPISALLPNGLRGLPGANAGTGKLLIPATQDIMKIKTIHYARTVDQGMAWINDDNSANGQLINIVFYNIINDFKVGGRGNLMLDTGVAKEKTIVVDKEGLSDDDYYKMSLKSVANIQTALKSLVIRNKLVKRGSRMESTFAKFRPDGGGYNTWFPVPVFSGAAGAEDTAHKQSLQARESIISGICLFKAKLIGYADDYLANLKASFGVNFKDHGSNYLPDAFKTDGHTIFNGFPTAIGLDNDQSNYKKHWALGVYAFHAILKHHLGTYNLSCLPPFGENEANDKAVRRALIDALATQWWISSAAWKQGQISGKMKPSTKCYQISMYNPGQLLAIPYIESYFNPERVWINFGANQAIFDDALLLLEQEGILNQAHKDRLSYLTSEITRLTDMAQLSTREQVDLAGNIKTKETLKNREKDLTLPRAIKDTKEKYRSFLQTPGPSTDFIENTAFILSLMPTGKTGAPELSTHIFSVLEELYQPILSTSNAAVDYFNKGMALKDDKPADFNYKTQTGTDYAKAFGSDGKMQTADEIKTKLTGFMSQQGDLTENQADIVSALSDLQMGTKLNAAGKAFSQADFNRQVLRALKHLLIELKTR
jgi:hypothetical protein